MDIADPEVYVLELAERTEVRMHAVMISPAMLGAVPMDKRLSVLGAHIGRSLSRLDNPEAVFRMIEDGMQPDNEEVANAVHRHLIPAMVEASAEAGTWDMLQRQLGEETRRWALEHYEFEVAPPEASELLPGELQRLKDLIRAAKSGDWNHFRELSDEPYANEEAMREQFEMSSRLLGGSKQCRILMSGATTARGGRVIHAEIGDPAASGGINVVFNSIGKAGDGPFGIWVFGPVPEWS